MRNLFNSVPRPAIRYNSYDLSFPNSFSADYGKLYPCLVKEVLAGEIFSDFSEDMVRTQPLVAPVFSRTDCSVHYFFVPNRLIYEDWTKFIVRGDDGNTDYDKPYINPLLFDTDLSTPNGIQWSLWMDGSLMDYLNFSTFAPSTPKGALPTTSEAPLDMMPFNAYSLIYNEYYRDENLIPEVFLWKASGYTQNYNDYQDYLTELHTDWFDPSDLSWLAKAEILSFPMFLRYRSWRKDYFTSALPFVQKGVPISLAGISTDETSLPVRHKSRIQFNPDSARFSYFYNAGSEATYFPSLGTYVSATVNESGTNAFPPNVGSIYNVQAYVDLPALQGSVMTISDLRVGMALQQWFELNARVGSDRYFEYLLGHFGVRDRDSRLQRPEYLGGFTHSIQISEVEQNSATVQGETPQGNLAGKGLGYAANSRVKYRFPEPGFLIAIFSIRPQAVYFQGLPRMYTRWDAFDYYDPLFDHLSEQPIYKSELFYQWDIRPQSDSDAVFGYTPRFSEYRTSQGEIHGNFRNSLRYWVSPRVLDSSVKLDRTFLEVEGYSQGLYKQFAYEGTNTAGADHFLVHMNHHIKFLRPMSKYATPKI
nr:MAG: major capsid protein [Microviridae sp.]